jgi:hypothetical protein
LNGELYEGLYARLYNKVLSPTGADDYVKIESDDNDYIRRGSFGVSFWFTKAHCHVPGDWETLYSHQMDTDGWPLQGCRHKSVVEESCAPAPPPGQPAGGFRRMQGTSNDPETVTFDTPGNHQWEVPDWANTVLVKVWGGGGGGGSGNGQWASGAGGGGFSMVTISGSDLDCDGYSIVVGAGGLGSITNDRNGCDGTQLGGDPGGDSSFGAISASGGGHGCSGTAGNCDNGVAYGGGYGGTGTTENGENGQGDTGQGGYGGAAGGASTQGGGARGAAVGNFNEGSPGNAPGGGGGGGPSCQNGHAGGGTGGNGRVEIVISFDPSLGSGCGSEYIPNYICQEAP